MKQFTIFFMLIYFNAVFSQKNEISIHQLQLSEYNEKGNSYSEYYESMPIEKSNFLKSNCNLEKIVYGWHPYWVGSAYQNYQWDLLSHFSFFSYEVNAVDGEPNSTHGWSTSLAVDSALSNGVKVTLCVTLFSNHGVFFGSSSSQQTLINNLINLVSSRGAHGVNIDFEGLPSSQATNFANFMVNLSSQMHAAIPGSEVSTVLYAVDWNDVFDFSIMEPFVDHYIIMGYAYYYSGSSVAGPTDPLYHFGSTYNYTLSRSITYYLDKGCPKNKLVLGLPNYGYEWSTLDLSVPSSTLGSGVARTYSYVKNNISGNYSSMNHFWEDNSFTDIFMFNNGENRQCIISLDSAWIKRLNHVRQTGIAGIAIWALGYDNGYNELWDIIENYLTDCYSDPCSGVFYDFGGPKNYYNDEDYIWTIAPPNATSIDVDFIEFDIEENYDYLYVYDGLDENSPQILGSPFTGTIGPGFITSSSGALTFRFTSDGATVKSGFFASYTCSQQAAPIASFSHGELNICLGDSIQLTNTSTGGSSYLWSTSSGGLSSSTDENTYFFPLTSGNYSITLEVFNNIGVDQISQNLLVNIDQPPLAIASASDVNLSLPSAIVYFSNISINATDYFWDFGDGNYSLDQDPWHEYTQNGTYDVLLIAMNDGCDNDTLSIQINVGTQGVINLLDQKIYLYPNPFKSNIYVESYELIKELIIYDFNRRVVLRENVDDFKMKINASQISNGSYLLEIRLSTGVLYRKVIKV
ncbi:MAG: hypothetical protein CL844_08290 [Crocinitomicaceae bacterium]|nr:hypothetical protein [Crocinitomicaceae bacterium]|tara:strand:+ start:36522 stop:38762 length:2241 start_codon:yes stop_codon:yes gene_type:complete